MSKFTEQEIKAKAEELKITLTEEQIKAYLILDQLPPDPNAEVEDLDDNTQKAINERIKKANEKTKQVLAELNEAKKRLADFEKIQTDLANVDAAKKGEWEKLKTDAEAAKKTAEEVITKQKELTKNNGISGAIKEGLLFAGINKDQMTKALKLFDVSKVNFSWINENNLEYEIEDISKLVEDFKKDNPFFFESENNGEPFTPGEPKQNRRQKATSDDEKIKRLEKTFSALRF